MTSCSCGSCGKSRLACFLTTFLYSAMTSLQRLGVEVGVELGLLLFLLGVENFVEYRSSRCRARRCRTSESGGDRSRRRSADCWLRLASASTLWSFRPRLRIVSIMPGMENFAPERTLTSSGFSPLPSFWPCRLSSLASASSIWRSTSFDTALWRMYSRQASVWMVKPGGTGRPALVISASPAPLPPRTSFILPLPSALPPPKKYTYFVVAGFVSVGFASMISVSGRVVVAM